MEGQKWALAIVGQSPWQVGLSRWMADHHKVLRRFGYLLRSTERGREKVFDTSISHWGKMLCEVTSLSLFSCNSLRFQKRDGGSKNKGKMSWNHGFIGIQMRVQREFDPILRTSVVNSTMYCLFVRKKKSKRSDFSKVLFSYLLSSKDVRVCRYYKVG